MYSYTLNNSYPKNNVGKKKKKKNTTAKYMKF